MNAGDRARARSEFVTALVIPVVLLYLLLEFVAHRSTRTSQSQSASDEDVGLVPLPWSDPRRAGPAAVALIAWLLLAILPVVHLHEANAEQRAQATASRQAVEITTMISASSFVAGFLATAEQTVSIDHQVTPLGRRFAATLTDDASLAQAQEVIAAADEAIAPAMHQMVATMARTPTREDGVDAETASAAATSPEDWDRLRVEQNQAADQAALSGVRAQRLAQALLFAALTLTLSALAAVSARRRYTVVRFGPATLVIAAIATASSAFLL